MTIAEPLDRVDPVELDISGMTCAACARRVERALNKLDGVDASVNYATERAVVNGLDEERIALAVQQVEKTGYGAHLHDGEDDAWSRRATEVRITSLRRRLVVAALLTIPLMDITIVFALVPGWRFPGWEWLCVLLALPIVTWAAWPFHRVTLKNLRHGTVSMDTLVSLGIAVSFGWALVTLVLGLDGPAYWLGFGSTPDGADAMYLDVAAGMTTFQLAGRYFETRSRRKAGDVLGALSRLAATRVRILRDGVEVVEPSARLRRGDTFVVLPGETIPADGDVTAGAAAVDASMMTGEPLPVEVVSGDVVTGGTISTDGRLEVRATSVGANTQLAQMAALAQRAQARKANVQTLADRVTTYFVPAVIVLALLVFVAWLLGGAPVQQAIGTGIAVLIIACPCALGLATPTALMVGIGRGASLGILVKGQDALEASGRITTVVLDKTGTLTTGRMAVQRVTALAELSEDELLRLAASLEQGSEHPIARAILARTAEHPPALPPFSDFSALPGLGASGRVAGHDVLIGNARLLAERAVQIPAGARVALDHADEQGRTAVLVARDGEVVGVIDVADEIKADAQAAIDALHEQGLETILLTGDSAAAGQRTADQLGINVVLAEVLPAQKAEVVRDLQARGKNVAMVGDGINDAVALSAADLGLAIATGTDIALKAADIILVREDLMVVPDAIALARRTLRTIRTNLGWAFGYNIAAIPLAAAGLLNPLIAAAAMSLSSMLVVHNSLRLQNFRTRRQ
ncbi:heavy metal translocating P-type ATPase [Promicromonospora alba]|uniref:Heavy metal translocating P-type ATPase n=1 Tax=Promicromonospora alba TaxID=1616110 RepID=A0ABV9HD11_9MICO